MPCAGLAATCSSAGSGPGAAGARPHAKVRRMGMIARTVARGLVPRRDEAAGRVPSRRATRARATCMATGTLNPVEPPSVVVHDLAGDGGAEHPLLGLLHDHRVGPQLGR